MPDLITGHVWRPFALSTAPVGCAPGGCAFANCRRPSSDHERSVSGRQDPARKLAGAPVDWARFRKCTVCAAGMGETCIELTSFQGGHHDPIPADRPHRNRKLRTGYGRG